MVLNVQLGVEETPIIMGETDKHTSIFSILFCNTHSGDTTINIHVCNSGDVNYGEDATAIIKNYTIPAEDTLIWTSGEKFVISADDIISGKADVADVVTVTPNFFRF